MDEIGKVLRSRREEMGRSLEEMEERTKIRKRYLEALEEGDWSLLPGHVYARGFVRSYADHLGLDGRALLAEHDSQHGSESASFSNERHPEGSKHGSGRPDSVKGNKPRPVQTTSKRQGVGSGPRLADRPGGRRTHKAGNSSKGWVGQTVAVVAILAALGTGWWWITQKAHPAKPYTATSNSDSAHVPSGLGGSSAESGASGGTNGVGTKPSLTSDSQGNQSADQKPNSAISKPKLVTTVTAKPIQGNSLTYVVSSTSPLHVVLLANDRLWTTVTADGVSLDGGGGELLAQGEAKPFAAKNTLTFVIGNLPAATFDVNGKKIVLPNVGRTLNVSFVKG